MTRLRQYFPLIRTRQEILTEISENVRLRKIYETWNNEQQETFLDYCTGNRGVKVLYDSFFKEIIDPETVPERAEEFLSLILHQRVRILRILPLESPRLGDEHSLVIMDIVIELEDRSIANLEVQKLGYHFPGQRSACYSADLLMRQHKHVRGEKGENFNYKDIKQVYTIVLYEKSTANFHQYTNCYIHRFSQRSDTGLEMNLLQEYIFVPLDIFRTILHNNGIRNKLEAWLTFFCEDDPDYIITLIQKYPQFKKYYEEIYELCRNTEKVIDMFSKELQELDRNTVQYMIDEQQETIDEQQKTIDKQHRAIASLEEMLKEQTTVIQNLNSELTKLKESLKEQK